MAHPPIIQGGMGVAVSNWILARAVAIKGQMGVVSGTALDSVLVRRLQDGDSEGHMRRALASFPIPSIVEEVLRRYFQPEGRRSGEPYKAIPMHRQNNNAALHRLTVLANYVEVWLAKEGHQGKVGINLLTKVQMPTLPSLYGAMLAGVDYVLMGAGIPKEIPGVLDGLARHEAVKLKLDVEGLDKDKIAYLDFEPKDLWGEMSPTELQRPFFLPIVASNSLAIMLAKKANGKVDGFIIEGPTAGGHNAPPRGDLRLNERGEPLYGERDEVDLSKFKELGLPFWIAGGTASPEALRSAQNAGACGVQVGTFFAYSEESGMTAARKAQVLQLARENQIDVLTDNRASPTGFPFKVVQISDTLANADIYAARERVCDLGYLRTAYQRPDGRLDYRCPAEPVDTYLKKGGSVEETVGRKCLCNALMADVGLAQIRPSGSVEPTLITSGDDLRNIHRFLNGRHAEGFTAADVIDYLLAAAS